MKQDLLGLAVTINKKNLKPIVPLLMLLCIADEDFLFHQGAEKVYPPLLRKGCPRLIFIASINLTPQDNCPILTSSAPAFYLD